MANKITLEEVPQLAPDGRQVYLYKDKTGKVTLFILQSYELSIATQQSVQRTPLTLFGMRVEIANWLKPGQWFIRPSRRR